VTVHWKPDVAFLVHFV